MSRTRPASSGSRTKLDRVDILVNNAAILYDTWARAASADLQQVHEALETNLFGALEDHARVPAAPAAKRPPPGRERLERQRLDQRDERGHAAYSISKAGLNALTRILAAELARRDPRQRRVPRLDRDGHGRGRWTVDPRWCEGVVWAAELPDDGPTGGFFGTSARSRGDARVQRGQGDVDERVGDHDDHGADDDHRLQDGEVRLVDRDGSAGTAGNPEHRLDQDHVRDQHRRVGSGQRHAGGSATGSAWRNAIRRGARPFPRAVRT